MRRSTTLRRGLLLVVALLVWLRLSVVRAAPSFDQFNIYFGNLHAHTALSDGSGTPDDAYDRARNTAKLDFLAVTEHNHSQVEPKDKGPGHTGTVGKDPALYAQLLQSAQSHEQADFVTLWGQEFSTISSGNHMNVFGTKEVIRDTEVENGDYKKFYESWLPDHSEVDALQLNHPWGNRKNEGRNYGLGQYSNSFEKLRKATEKLLRLIEVINGPGLKNQNGLPAKVEGESYYKKYLTRGFRIAPTADQDNHYFTWGTLTDARTGVLATELTHSGIVKGLQARRCYATTSKSLHIWFAVNDAIMGSEITSDTRELTVHYKIQDSAKPSARYKLTLIVGNPKVPDSAKEVKLTEFDGDKEDRVELTMEPSTAFLYLKAAQGTGTTDKRVALTSPVWVRVP